MCFCQVRKRRASRKEASHTSHENKWLITKCATTCHNISPVTVRTGFVFLRCTGNGHCHSTIITPDYCTASAAYSSATKSEGPIQGVRKMQTAQWSGNARIPSRPGGPELKEGQSVNHSTYTKKKDTHGYTYYYNPSLYSQRFRMRVFNWFPITSITFAAPIGEAFFVAFALPRGKFLGHKLPELHLPQDGMSGLSSGGYLKYPKMLI